MSKGRKNERMGNILKNKQISTRKDNFKKRKLNFKKKCGEKKISIHEISSMRIKNYSYIIL